MGKNQQPSLMDDPRLVDDQEQANITDKVGDQQDLTDEVGSSQSSEIVKMECTVASQTEINGVIHNFNKGETLDITLAESENLPCDRWKKV